MIKVCHFTSVHKANDVRIFEKECISLAKAGYDVFLVAPNAKNGIENGVHIVGIDLQNAGRLYRIIHLSKVIYKKALDIDADIYHFHDPELLKFGVKLKQKGKIVIFDSHEDIPSDIKHKKYLPYIVRIALYFLYKMLESYSLKKFDAIITVTPHIVNKLKHLNAKTFMITNYPIIKADEINKNPTNSKFTQPTIAFAGCVNQLWMHENIIKSLDNIKQNIRYIIAGPISAEYLNKLKALQSWNKVEYLGIISRTEVETLYSKSHIGMALMDYTENCGGRMGTLGNTKLFEIMQSSLPIICTDYTLWKEIVEDHKTGICINPHNIQAISNAIEKLINNPEEAKLMGEKGMEVTLASYNWKTQETCLLNIYKKLIS